MPSIEALEQQAQESKAAGNEAFAKGDIAEAISLYSNGLVTCDRATVDDTTTSTTTSTTESSSGSSNNIRLIKMTLLSNRAMCYLKDLKTLDSCVDDCTTGLALDPSDVTLRNKLLFRRAKARFLLYNLKQQTTTGGSSSSSKNDSVLHDAAKDLLQVLQSDAQNKDAQQLLTTVRAQYKSQQATQASTPVSKAVENLRDYYRQHQEDNKKDNEDLMKQQIHQIKLILGMLDNDLNNTAMELGRIGAVPLLLVDILLQCTDRGNTTTTATQDKLVHLSMQCVSQAASHPAFARTYLVPHQTDLKAFLQNPQTTSESVVLALAALVRVILHADRDPLDQDISGATLLDHDAILQSIWVALRRSYHDNDNNSDDKSQPKKNTVIRAVLDLIGTWTAGTDRDSTIRHSLGQGMVDPTLPIPKTQAEIRAFTPQQLAAYRKRQVDQKDRDGAWAFERCTLLLSKNDASGGFTTLLQTACSVHDHVIRREIIVTVGRILAVLDDDDRIKNVVKPYLQMEGEKYEGIQIEEVHDEDEKVATVSEEKEEMVVTLEQMMERAIITCALLLSKKEVGSWALSGTGWMTAPDELSLMVQSQDSRAMCLVSEVVSAAATLEMCRPLVATLMNSTVMEQLLKSKDRDIRSGAASAVAKLGLSNREAQKDEGEVMGMLQAACDLLEDDDNNDSAPSTSRPTKDESKLRHFSSFATSSVERAVEMISYLIYSTIVKEELAAGFQPHPESSVSALQRLVKTADLPNAGESLTGFALATIFQNMAATNLQLRKEGFEGREVTMEQYDEMQKIGKTAEEQEVMDSQQDPDTTASCHERIRKMASANVPRAMVTLIEGASEHTLEQIIMGLNRMANEESVRGILIQQGVLSACIKMEKNEGPTETDTMKKVIQLARHCIAKMLVTTNPSLLTSAQRLGTIRPLIQLVRDNKSSDLQKFEALLSLTNIAGSGDDAQKRIASERGIASLHFAMFADHEMVRRAATEAMSNMIPHESMMKHLAEGDNARLWLAFATDYEENYECARAATGCLAMATQQDELIAEKVAELSNFQKSMELLLESGRLEIMHRAFVIVLNLVQQSEKCKQAVISAGLVAFSNAYVSNYHSKDGSDLDFPDQERALLPVTADLAKTIVQLAE
ncbi:hypothetical protein ACA910_022097 [Epithemia clementina (nom. ined.)]